MQRSLDCGINREQRDVGQSSKKELSETWSQDKTSNDLIETTRVLIKTRIAMIQQNQHVIRSLNEEIEAHIQHAFDLEAWRFDHASAVASQAKEMVEALEYHRDWFETQNAKLLQGVEKDWLLLCNSAYRARVCEQGTRANDDNVVKV